MFNFIKTLLNRWRRFLGVKTIFWSYTTQRKQSNKFSSSMSQLLARWISKLSRLTHRVVPLKFSTSNDPQLISSQWSPQLWSSLIGRDHSPLLHLSLTMRCFSMYKKCSIPRLQSNDALKFSGFPPQRRCIFPSGFGLEHFCCWVQLDFAKIFLQICLPLLSTNRWRDRVTSLVKNKFSVPGMFVLISSMSFLIPPTAYPARCGLLLTTLLVDI